MKFQQVNILRLTGICLTILFLGLMSAPITLVQAEIYSSVAKWGSLGTGEGQFLNPRDIALDTSGNIYVADEYNGRIIKFSNNGTYITNWSTYDNGHSMLPICVAVDSSDNVYVGDYQDFVLKFDSKGTYKKKLGSYGSDTGEFFRINGIAVDSDDHVYVADSGNRRIQKFDSHGTTYKGENINSQIGFPVDVAVDSSGNVYVLDSVNYCIKKFDKRGNLKDKWGSYGTGDGQFVNPLHIAIDSKRNIYVSDSGSSKKMPDIQRIEKFDRNGKFITNIGVIGSLDGQIYTPEGIAVDSSGIVYVVDMGNGRIQKFAQNNIFYPGINWIVDDEFYKKIAVNLRANKMDSYKGTNIGSGAIQVYLASKTPPIATDTNFLTNISDSGNYNIAFAHSGGTRTLVDKIESGTVTANYLVLAAPVMITQEELQGLTKYGVKKVVVYQSSFDLLNLLKVTLERNHRFNDTIIKPALVIRLEDIPSLAKTFDIRFHYPIIFIFTYHPSNEELLTEIDKNPSSFINKIKDEFNLQTDVKLERINGSHYLIINIEPYLTQTGYDSSILDEAQKTFFIGGSNRKESILFKSTGYLITMEPHLHATDSFKEHKELVSEMTENYSNSLPPFDGITIPDLKGLK